MSITRALLYLMGAGLVVAGLILLFFETGLAAWVPPGIAVAGLVILVGVLVMGMSDREETTEVQHTEHHHHEHER